MQGNRDIGIVESVRIVSRGGSGTQGIQLRLQLRIGNAVQHSDRVQDLVLLHIGIAQRNVKLHRGAVRDGIDQCVLRLGVISVSLILVGKLDGHILVLTAEVIGQIIEERGQLGVAVCIAMPGLLQQHIQGKTPVIDEKIPADAGNDQGSQQNRHNDFHKFIHTGSPFPGIFLSII